ncbi:hypothetical protein JCM10908_005556 [Rhodotorula pacifica]|uniref:uncharacterized protein n=1 Tax=Rhodotorula pacifica TaxID=1495444 RepID=UPI00317946D4
MMRSPAAALVRPWLAHGNSLPLRAVPRTRLFASTASAASGEPAKVPVALISKVRAARPGTPLSLAKSALAAANNDLDAALAWIAKQAAESGAKKQEKLASRTAEQGLVAVAVLADGTGQVGVRAALVELRCETDFVARTDEFRELAEGIARSLAYFAEPSTSSSSSPAALTKLDTTNDLVLETPVVPSPARVAALAESGNSVAAAASQETVRSSLAQIVSRLGENIRLHRAASISLEPGLPPSSSSEAEYAPRYLASSYLHASKTPAEAAASGVQSGTLGGLVLARLAAFPAGTARPETAEVKGLLRALARQVVAVPTESVRPEDSSAAPAAAAEGEQSLALYEQPLITLAPTPKFEFEGGSKVGEVLARWSELRGLKQADGLEVVELARWELGAAEAEASE